MNGRRTKASIVGCCFRVVVELRDDAGTVRRWRPIVEARDEQEAREKAVACWADVTPDHGPRHATIEAVDVTTLHPANVHVTTDPATYAAIRSSITDPSGARSRWDRRVGDRADTTP